MLEKYCKTYLEKVTQEKNHVYVKKPQICRDFRGGITVLATVLGISAPANAIIFTTYTDRTAWEAAVGGSFSEETFNSFTVDTSFDGVNVDVGDFTLNGTSNISGRQEIDVPPLDFSSLDVDGTPVISGFTNSSSSFTATFDSPITAFGADFSSVSDAGTTQLIAGSDVVGSVPVYNNTGFFGFIADGSLTTLTVDSATGSGDGFGMDNVVYDSSSASVPFEFSPTLGLLAVGSIWGVFRLRKRMAVSKITE